MKTEQALAQSLEPPSHDEQQELLTRLGVTRDNPEDPITLTPQQWRLACAFLTQASVAAGINRAREALQRDLVSRELGGNAYDVARRDHESLERLEQNARECAQCALQDMPAAQHATPQDAILVEVWHRRYDANDPLRRFTTSASTQVDASQYRRVAEFIYPSMTRDEALERAFEDTQRGTPSESPAYSKSNRSSAVGDVVVFEQKNAMSAWRIEPSGFSNVAFRGIALEASSDESPEASSPAATQNTLPG